VLDKTIGMGDDDARPRSGCGWGFGIEGGVEGTVDEWWEEEDGFVRAGITCGEGG